MIPESRARSATGFSCSRCLWSGRRAGILGAALLALAGALGCATQQVSLHEGPREYVATDYENVLKRWTRTEHLIALSELDNFLTATATFEACALAYTRTSSTSSSAFSMA